MRIAFMGTPAFAACALQRLYDDGHDICCVFTQPDKPRDRGMKVACCPAKELAAAYGTPIVQPATLRDGQALELLRGLRPDLIAVVAYGRLLPPEILELPPLGCINIHGSLLPKYRGSAPIQRAVLNGETETGVTSQFMAQEMDTGDMLLVKKTAIGPEETSGELFSRLGVLGAELLGETVAAIGNGTAVRIPQKNEDATFAPPITKDMSPIDWQRTAQEIVNQVRGLNPWPMATADIGGVRMKIFKASRYDGPAGDTPGEIIATGTAGITVACSDGAVTIRELQAPNGRRMAAADYLRGHPLCR